MAGRGRYGCPVISATGVRKNRYRCPTKTATGVRRSPLHAREAIINAVVHRDYVGAHTQIKVYPDRLALWNEGGLPSGIKIEDLKKSHASKPRNELIADVFFKAG